jgi:hypothetical protein
MELEACACEFDGDSPEFMTTTYHSAQKKYLCCECGENIHINEKYQRIVGKWESKVETYKTCGVCAKIRNDYAPCSSLGNMWEELNELLEDDEKEGWRGGYLKDIL